MEGFTDVPEQGIGGKLFTSGGSLGHHHTPFDRQADCTSACEMRAKGGPSRRIVLASIASTASTCFIADRLHWDIEIHRRAHYGDCPDFRVNENGTVPILFGPIIAQGLSGAKQPAACR